MCLGCDGVGATVCRYVQWGSILLCVWRETIVMWRLLPVKGALLVTVCEGRLRRCESYCLWRGALRVTVCMWREAIEMWRLLSVGRGICVCACRLCKCGYYCLCREVLGVTVCLCGGRL